jgi:hypothetical protein
MAVARGRSRRRAHGAAADPPGDCPGLRHKLPRIIDARVASGGRAAGEKRRGWAKLALRRRQDACPPPGGLGGDRRRPGDDGDRTGEEGTGKAGVNGGRGKPVRPGRRLRRQDGAGLGGVGMTAMPAAAANGLTAGPRPSRPLRGCHGRGTTRPAATPIAGLATSRATAAVIVRRGREDARQQMGREAHDGDTSADANGKHRHTRQKARRRTTQWLNGGSMAGHKPPTIARELSLR